MIRYAVTAIILAETAAQLPIDLPLDPWLRFGVTGFLAAIIVILLTRTMPAQDAAHAAERKALSDAHNGVIKDLKDSQAQSAVSICEALESVQKAVDDGTARQCDLLAQALWPRARQ